MILIPLKLLEFVDHLTRGDKSLLLYDLACHDLDLVIKKLGCNFIKESSQLENDIYYYW